MVEVNLEIKTISKIWVVVNFALTIVTFFISLDAIVGHYYLVILAVYWVIFAGLLVLASFEVKIVNKNFFLLAFLRGRGVFAFLYFYL